jgi:hypothetical protein
MQLLKSKGVTEANKAALAKRVVHFDYDSSDLSTEDYQTLAMLYSRVPRSSVWPVNATFEFAFAIRN